MYQEPYELGRPDDGYPVRIRARGRSVLSNPMLNRGTAFTHAERRALRLQGLLPSGVAPARPGRRGRAAVPGRRASRCRQRQGAARSVLVRPSKRTGRFASQATALRAAHDLGASATLRQVSQGRRP